VTAEGTAARRGRPPRTTGRDLELVALRLFTERGYDGTTVDDLAAAVGISRRSFFRYFDAKADVLWGQFDSEVERLRAALADVPAELSVMAAIRQAVGAVNRYSAAAVDELRTRMTLVSTVPELAASAAVHYDAWEQVVIDFAARRTGLPAEHLYPVAVGRATLATCRAAYEQWAARGDADLTVYLDAALGALAGGFSDDPPAGQVTAVSPAPR
jgi:mycofactocin system transcriptional regulator